MRVLGLDVGDRRIGVALSDPLGLTAQRLTVLDRRGIARDIAAVRALVERHEAKTVVVGLPLTMGGVQGVQANKVTAFSDALRRQITVPVQLVDERLTTVQGTRALLETGASRGKRKQLIDVVADKLILQQFLDTQGQSASS